MTSRDLIRDLWQAKLELQDVQVIEEFWFVDDDRVVATLGTKGEAVCGPVLNYTIADDDSVRIGNSNETLCFKWEQLKISGEELIVLCDGVLKKFHITRAPKKERWLP